MYLEFEKYTYRLEATFQPYRFYISTYNGKNMFAPYQIDILCEYPKNILELIVNPRNVTLRAELRQYVAEMSDNYIQEERLEAVIHTLNNYRLEYKITKNSRWQVKIDALTKLYSELKV